MGDEHWDAEWGSYDVLGTAAFWVDQTVREDHAEQVAAMATGTDFETELVYCLLGGFGVTAELAHAACQVVLEMIAADPRLTADDLERRLREPLPDGMGRYRFPRQRSQRIAAALTHTRDHPPPDEPLALRAYLLGLNGVGPKTAGWIVRNLTGSADVAIIDIWLIRALTPSASSNPSGASKGITADTKTLFCSTPATETFRLVPWTCAYGNRLASSGHATSRL